MPRSSDVRKRPIRIQRIKLAHERMSSAERVCPKPLAQMHSDSKVRKWCQPAPVAANQHIDYARPRRVVGGTEDCPNCARLSRQICNITANSDATATRNKICQCRCDVAWAQGLGKNDVERGGRHGSILRQHREQRVLVGCSEAAVPDWQQMADSRCSRNDTRKSADRLQAVIPAGTASNGGVARRRCRAPGASEGETAHRAGTTTGRGRASAPTAPSS